VDTGIPGGEEVREGTNAVDLMKAKYGWMRKIRNGCPQASGCVKFTSKGGANMKWLRLPIWLILFIVMLSSQALCAPVKEFLIHVDTIPHQRFGLYYPVTYKFNLPPGMNGLVAQYRYSTADVWSTLPEKKNTDLFNGIAAVRFDYLNRLAYASINFRNSSDNIYLRFLDFTGRTLPVYYDSIPQFYDDRKAAVTITLDDWGYWDDADFRLASDFLGSNGLYFTVGIITSSVIWESVQEKINLYGDYLEVASHSVTHPCTGADYELAGYQSEVLGSRDAIRDNLTFKNHPYVPAWLEPCGYSDATMVPLVAAGDYLLSRCTDTFFPFGSTFVPWDSASGMYGRAGLVFPTSVYKNDMNLLTDANWLFDQVMTEGSIYHLSDHPWQGLWVDGSFLLQHLNYVKGRSDVWYVPFGQLYQYHFIQEMRGNLSIQPTDTDPVANFTATPLSGVSPLPVTFTDTSTGPVTGWLWDFGDSATSALQNPLHVYTVAGNYTVNLTASSPGGSDVKTISNYISVMPGAPPAVSVTAPVNGASFSAPATVPISATATAGTGATVSRVDFYSGATLIGTATATPFSVSWNNVAAGSYALTAKVTDSLGGTATSSPVAVSVVLAMPPSATITTPANNASFSAPATVPISATATAGAGATVSRVDFYSGATLIGTATATPFSVSWNNVAAGSYALTAKVTDSLGGTATSSPVAVSVVLAIPPSATISAPANNASFSAPATVPIGATATAGTGATVSRVDFYSGATLIGTAATSPYSMTWSNVTAGSYLLTAKVTDTLGATASSSPAEITVDSGTSLPSPWSSQDIGGVALAGSAGFQNGVFTVSGSGSDIWLAADDFRYLYQSLTGDGQIVARVSSLQNTDAWAKGGVMVRDTLANGSANAFLAITPGNGVNFQWRQTAGAESMGSGPSAATAPFWLRLSRNGSLFSGYASADGVNWVLVGSDTIAMGNTVFIGLALTSHNDAELGTAKFDGVTVTAGSVAVPTVSITSPVNGASFSAPAIIPITAAATAGTAATVSRVDFYAGTTLIGTASTTPYSVTWNNVSAGSYSLTAKVTDSSGETATSSPIAVSVATAMPPAVVLSAPANGALFSAPATIAVTATATAGTGATVRQVDYYAGATLIGTAAASPYSITWSNVAAGSYSLTAKVTDTLGATASSIPVGITVGGGTSLPSPWSSQDIGPVALAGSAGFQDGVFTLSGSGADIWLAADAFRFVYQSMTGDGQIVARVSSLQNTDPWAKGGVMVRETLANGSANAFLAITPVNGINFQRRLSAGADSVDTGPSAGTAPFWLKLLRNGSLFSGYASADGVNWVLIGSDTITMGNSVFFGLALTSHNDAALGTANFDAVTVTAGSIAVPTVSITAPVNGASFSAPANMPITATATAGTGATVSRVDFDAGATLVGTATVNPYTVTWNGVAAGNYSLTAKVTDSLGGTATSSPITVSVNNPDLTITKTHSGNFKQGQAGAIYTITVKNSGAGPTNGMVTMTDALPSGLTATAISGSGWTCTLGTLTCTRSTTLAAGSSYPSISLTVNVASNAPASVTNTATVSGGGEANTSNDTASDPTTITTTIPDLTITKSHSGNFRLGQTGAIYTITVKNSGTGSTSGAVTVTDTLPSGLTATALSGSGWTCTLGVLTCTRSTALAAGSSYPSINLTVKVASNAPASVTNTVTVSGGGEVNTSNDTASNPTTIGP
jgi:uncharacterized repeat protein (TIGR01451 family)